MPILPISCGNVTTKEQPGSPVITITTDTTRVRRVWKGLYSALLSSPPMAVGQSFGINGAVVETATTTADRGSGLGTFIAEGSNVSVYPTPVYSTESVDLQKDIITHPRYQTGGANALAQWNDFIALDAWKNETDITKRLAWKYYLTDSDRQAKTNEQTLSANAQHVAKKIAQGTTSYNIGYYIVRATTYWLTRPAIDKIYIKDDPPAAANKPSGYYWLKIADSRSFNGKYWTRNEVWMGVEKIDNDLYS